MGKVFVLFAALLAGSIFEPVCQAVELNPEVIRLLEHVQSEVKEGNPTPCPEAPPAAPKECEPFSEDFLRKQALLPFHEKFSLITSDIPRQSQSNLSSLRSLLFGKRPGFQKYYGRAKSQVSKQDGKLSVEHRTRAATAQAILNSGELLSLDELIRRGIVSPRAKFGVSKVEMDGKIGQQDVVFLSIGESSKVTEEYAQAFGEIVFVFDKEKTLRKGYFGLIPFDHSPSSFDKPVSLPPNRCHESKALSAAPFYRDTIFAGMEAYREVLTLSIAEILWEKDQGLKPLYWNLAGYVKAHESSWPAQREGSFDPNGSEVIEEEKAWARRLSEMVRPLLEKFGQPVLPPESSLAGQFELEEVAEQLLQREKENEVEGTAAILKAPQGFPMQNEGYPIALTAAPYFLELKVPSRLSLDLLQEIKVPNEDVKAVKASIQDFAKRSGRKLTIERRGRETVFKLAPAATTRLSHGFAMELR